MLRNARTESKKKRRHHWKQYRRKDDTRGRQEATRIPVPVYHIDGGTTEIVDGREVDGERWKGYPP